MVKSRVGDGGRVAAEGGRPGGVEAVAMLAAAAGIVAAQRFGLWPDALQGAAGMIVQAIAVLAPALPRGSRWAMSRLRRRGGTASIAPSRGATAEAATGAATPSEAPETRGVRQGSAAAAPAGVGAAEEPAETADFLADYLPDPTMWPSWPPVADNDDEARRDADEADAAKPTVV